jgi:hypothetical protein
VSEIFLIQQLEVKKEGSMAKVQLDHIILGISGTVGKDAFRTSRMSKAFISKRRERSQRKPSEAQRERFKLAKAYAQAASSEPIYAELAERAASTPYRLAFSDWCHAPVIHSVERRCEHIDISATDDAHVIKIYVTITNEGGITLEQGQAILIQEGRWRYETEVPGNLLVEAWDLAGNVVRHQVEPGWFDEDL